MLKSISISQRLIIENSFLENKGHAADLPRVEVVSVAERIRQNKTTLRICVVNLVHTGNSLSALADRWKKYMFIDRKNPNYV